MKDLNTPKVWGIGIIALHVILVPFAGFTIWTLVGFICGFFLLSKEEESK